MRSRWSNNKGKGKGKGNGGRREETTENQLAFNVVCLAVAVGGGARTEECRSKFED